MEIILAEAAGFCFGVQRALDTALNTTEQAANRQIHTLGPLIHNPQVVEELRDKGIRVLDDPGDINDGVVIVRSHGVPPKTMDELVVKGLEVVDATCPFVRRAMDWAKQLKDEGYQVVIVGDESHPEVQAIYGASDETAWIVDTPRVIDELPITRRIGIIAQTTQSTANFRDCVSRFIGRTAELKAFNSICTATEQRQAAARKLVSEVDVMIVIGGFNSANTKRLVEVCLESGAKHTYHIEKPEELKSEWFVGMKKVGVTAGASTPNWLIEGVIKRMSEFNEEKVMVEVEEKDEANVVENEATEEVAEEVVADNTMEDFTDMPTPEPDTIVTGKVVQVGTDEVLVDIGYKSEGQIPLNELGLRADQTPADVVKVDDEIQVWVVSVDDAEGNVVLSKRRVDMETTWEELEKVHEEDGSIKAEVSQTVKGGLLVDLGVRGFIPASQVSREFVDDLEKFVGQTLELKIIELDREKNNVVLSHRELLEAQYQAAKEKVFSSLEENTIVEGVVRRLTDFGAFVDIGDGVEGLLHVSEIAHSRIKHPSDVLSEGQEINVMVLGVDKEQERISLGLKQTIPSPWKSVAERYAVGDKVSGVVTRVVDFGAFVKVEDGVEGLVHISQLSHQHVAKAEEVVKPGDEVEVKIISLDPEARRIGLSIRELEPKPEVRKPAPKQTRQTRQVEETSTEELTTTLGDVFGDLFKNNK